MAFFPPLPHFNQARGAAALESAPPFNFRGVTMRNFALRANIATLSDFCDSYLNIVPPEIAYFRPAAPFVILSLINYGKMASEVLNTGWVSQNEVVFNVPIEWYREEAGRLVFQDFASFSPYIYVDSAMSEATGREVFGWPKEQAWMTPEIFSWARDPQAPQTLMSISKLAYKAGSSPSGVHSARLLDIVHHPPTGFSSFPPDLWNVMNPLFSLPRAALNCASLIGEFADMLVSSPLRGYAPRGLDSIMEMASKVFDNLKGLPTIPGTSTLNLKQFRDAVDSDLACFQALTNGTMKPTRINRGGILGDTAMLAGDPSAGFEVRLHRHTAGPIIDNLGLQVASRSYSDEGDICVLRPLFPYWVDVDLYYGEAKPLCWRAKGYRHEEGKAPSWFFVNDSGKMQEVEPKPGDKGEYNTTRAVPFLGVSGPIRIPRSSSRVLPLFADPDRLEQFCDEYLNAHNPGPRFHAWGQFVYMVATNYEGMVTEDTGEISTWGRRQVAFAVPVRRVTPEDGCVECGLVYPFIYVDSDFMAIQGRETVGSPMMRASLRSPASSWMQEFVPTVQRESLLTLSTDVIPVLGVGREIKRRKLLEVYRGDPPEEVKFPARHSSTDRSKYEWDLSHLQDVLGEDAEEVIKEGRLEAIKLLLGYRPFTEFSIKQFRDAEFPTRASYLSLVTAHRLFEHDRDDPPDVKAFPNSGEDLYVTIRDYPTQPIAETLGLRESFSDLRGDRVVRYFQPWNPFWIKADVRLSVEKEQPWYERRAKLASVCEPIPTLENSELEPQMLIDILLPELGEGIDDPRAEITPDTVTKKKAATKKEAAAKKETVTKKKPATKKKAAPKKAVAKKKTARRRVTRKQPRRGVAKRKST